MRLTTLVSLADCLTLRVTEVIPGKKGGRCGMMTEKRLLEILETAKKLSDSDAVEIGQALCDDPVELRCLFHRLFDGDSKEVAYRAFVVWRGILEVAEESGAE